MSRSAKSAIGRRALLAGALALTATPAFALPVEHVRAIRLDLDPLAARGLAGFADYVRPLLQQALGTAFAARLAPGDRRAPVLVVSVSDVRLSSFVGGDGFRGLSGGGPQDYIEGVGTLLGSGGALISRTPILQATPASASGAWYLPDNERRRIATLARNFAYWLNRRV